MQYRTIIFASIVGDIHCIFKDDFLIKVNIKDARRDIINTPTQIFRSKFDLDSIIFDEDYPPLFNQLQLYFRGALKEFQQPFRFIRGTAFEQAVWLTLKEIPFGETRTYKWLADKIEKPLSYRAVGQALKKNPLPLILPCHRVIASDRSIGGFSFGTEIKEWLLKHESGHI